MACGAFVVACRAFVMALACGRWCSLWGSGWRALKPLFSEIFAMVLFAPFGCGTTVFSIDTRLIRLRTSSGSWIYAAGCNSTVGALFSFSCVACDEILNRVFFNLSKDPRSNRSLLIQSDPDFLASVALLPLVSIRLLSFEYMDFVVCASPS